MRLRDERTMRGGDDEQRIDPRAAFGEHVTVLDDDERRPGAHAAARLCAETRERVGGMLLPVAVRFEDHRRARRAARESRDEILDAPRAEAPRDVALIVRGDAGLWRVAAEQDRNAQLDPADGGPSVCE